MAPPLRAGARLAARQQFLVRRGSHALRARPLAAFPIQMSGDARAAPCHLYGGQGWQRSDRVMHWEAPVRGFHATSAAWDEKNPEKPQKPPPEVTKAVVAEAKKVVVEAKKQAASGGGGLRKMPTKIAAWGKNVALEVRENPAVIAGMPRRGWKAIKHVVNHVVTGCKLLAAETRIASRIIGRILQGRSISRRERSLLQRVITDLLRLIPFSFFIIIPAMEIFLPAALWLFPNMMPSQFSDEKQRSDKKKRRLGALVDSAKFLADCLERDAKYLHERNKDKMDLSDFIGRLRTGQAVPNELIFSIAKHFKDEFLLDNLPRPQLIAMCSFLHIGGPFGPDVHVRFLLRRRMRQIQADDKEIFWEGVASLSEDEVSEACELRGIRADRSIFEARRMLGEWLELSTRKDLPMSLILFSRAAEVANYDRRSATQQAQQINLAVTSLPDSVVDELIEEEVGDKISRERKLELLKEQEKLVIEEQKMEDEELEEQKGEIKLKKEEEKKKKKKKQEEKQEEQELALEAQAGPASAPTATDTETTGGAATATAAKEAAAPATKLPASVQAEAVINAERDTAEGKADDSTRMAKQKAEKDEAEAEVEEEEEEEEEAKVSLDGRESLTLDQAEHVFEELAALRKENDARRREAEDMTKLLDLLATGSVVTEEKQHLQELREMINRLSPHRTPTITLKDTVIRDKPTDSRLLKMDSWISSLEKEIDDVNKDITGSVPNLNLSTGKMSTHELLKGLTALREKVDPSVLEQTLTALDTNNDGYFSKEDIERVINEHKAEQAKIEAKKAGEMRELLAAQKAAAPPPAPADDEPEQAASPDAAALIDQEMREPISEEMEAEQKKKKASSGV